jgi:hypothetical protein
MASEHLRVHYVFYFCLLRALAGRQVNFFDNAEAARANIFVPASAFNSVLPGGLADDRVYSALF